MLQASELTPEQQAYLGVVAAAAGVLLAADLVLLGALEIGKLRARSLLARRWSAAHVLVAFQAWLIPVIGCMLLTGIVLAVASPDAKKALQLEQRWMPGLIAGYVIVQSTAMAGVVLFTVLVLYDQWPAALGLSLRNWGPKAAIGLLAAGAALPFNIALERISILALRHAPFPSLVQRGYEQQLSELLSVLHVPGGLVWGILLIGIVAPMGEELFFRGLAYRCFRVRWGRVVGTLSSAALFAVIHLSPAGLLSIFVVGCVLAILYERTGTLVAPITLHATNNIVAVLLAYFAHR